MTAASIFSFKIINFLIELGFYLGTSWLNRFWWHWLGVYSTDCSMDRYFVTDFINEVNRTNGKHKILSYKLKTIKGKMEPVKDILCFLVTTTVLLNTTFWPSSPSLASSLHSSSWLASPESPASSVSLHYSGIFTLPSTMPPAPLTTINISPEPSFLILHALHIWSVSWVWCSHLSPISDPMKELPIPQLTDKMW